MKTIEDYELEYIKDKNKNSCECKKCKTSFIFKPDEVWWDDKGYGYSTKLCKCTNCGCVNVVKHQEDYGFSKINYDRRLYFSNK